MLFLTFLPTVILAQGENQFIILSGVVLDGQTSEPVPGVHVYIPSAGRGEATDYSGYFHLPTLPGDSIVVSAIGYTKQHFIVPERAPGVFSVVVELKEDVTQLPIVEVFPYPTEELFKEAVLAVRLQDDAMMQALRDNYNSKLIWSAASKIPMDGSMNHLYYTRQQFHNISTQNMPPLGMLSLLNPFAWANFFKSIKDGDLKRGSWNQSRK